MKKNIRLLLGSISKINLSSRFHVLFIIILVFSLGIGVGFGLFNSNKVPINNEAVISKNIHLAFLMEIYDKVKENYWDSISDEQLSNLYKLAAEKVTGYSPKLKVRSPNEHKQALEEMLSKILKDLDDKQKKEFTVNLASAVLANLNPVGRSGLFTQKQEEQLKNKVENINPEVDLYKDLGIGKNASKEEIEKTFRQKLEKLKTDKTETGQRELKKITYAHDVLKEKDKKEKYDEKGIEPTVFSKLISPQILYIRFLKYSPTTYEEFQKVFNDLDKAGGPYGLIFDLRGNIGGAIDSLPYFLGNFIGKNQYAFDFYQKGEYEPFKTVTDILPSLERYKQMVVLVDNQTQSSAELMASTLKKYNIAVVVGETTKGWGTVERIFQIDNQIDSGEKYSMFLVHHITIRDDNQPVEGRGVEPNIKISDLNWEKLLFDEIRYSELVSSTRQVLSQPPDSFR